jgi:molybdopterin-guanine dinucleotide biosynthesis protein B
MPEEILFSVTSASLDIPAQEMPGYRGARVQCAACGEGINYHREVKASGRTLCIPCARDGLLPSGNAVTTPKVLLIVGYKKVGKTTLLEKLIPELSKRGYRVGTVKHHHSDFPVSVDTVGTDTWRHRQAGAVSVALATPSDIATFRDGASSVTLDQLVAALGPTDIVLVEGFHEEPRAKIEVLSDSMNKQLCKTDGHLLAFVAPSAPETPVPTFEPNNIKPHADLIEREVLRSGASRPISD